MSKLSTTVQFLPRSAAAAAWALAALIGQSPLAAEPLEDQAAALVAETLQANTEIAAGEARVAQRLAEIDEARARFLPSIDVTARYSRASGGRTIDLPLGDLLNPVYAALSASGAPGFAPIANQRIDLLRPTEQDTRITLTQSLYDARRSPALDASRDLHRGATASLAALRARLARDVQQGYYRWLAARDRLAILDSAQELAASNVRANQSLVDNGKITRDLLLRAEADLLEIEQQRRASASAVTLAASYLNLLRRAPLDHGLPEAALDPDSPARLRAALIARIGGVPLELDRLTARALKRRPELVELESGVAASTAEESIARAALKPRVGVALDAGSQGERYAFGADDRFVQASVVVQFKAFSGGADRARWRAAHAGTAALQAELDRVELDITLQVQAALEALTVAESSLDTAARRVDAAAAAFRIVSRKRDLGTINQTEFLDARHALTDANLNLSATRADALARLAELEYAVGARADD